MKKHIVALILISIFCLAVVGEEEKKLLPSEASKQMNAEFSAKYKKFVEQQKENPDLKFDRGIVRKELAGKYLNVVQTSGLNQDENLQLANLFSSAGKKEQALSLYKQLDTGSSIVAYKASVARMRALMENEDYETAEALVVEHQARFLPSSEMAGMLSSVIRGLAGNHARNGNHAKAVDLVMSEVRRVPETLDYPYSTPTILGYVSDSFIAVGKKDELFELMGNFAEKYEQEYEKRKGNMPEGNSREARVAQYQTRAFNSTARRLRSSITQANLTGNAAPVIDFSRVYNATRDMTFGSLKGKVVMIDFWANWCGPCKAAFPTLRELYARYKDKGFVILGVTGLQGRFYDGNIRKQSVEPEEEIKLTEDFIKHHEMSWPVVFSDRGPFDPKYGVSGIPTMVILDRNGTVHEIKVGFNPAEVEDLRKTIEKLIAD